MSDIKRTWTAEEIKEELKVNDTWVWRGVMAIWHKQTEDEREIEDTKHHNGVGFNGLDARIMSSFANQIKKWNPERFKSPLSPRQMEIARKKIIKYSGQLAKIANGEI